MTTQITRVETRNVQGVIYAMVEPKTNGVTKVGGDNASGKSSLFKSIEMTLCGATAFSEVPLRIGEDHGECEITLAEDVARRMPRCKVKRVWDRKSNDDGTFRLTTDLVIRTDDAMASRASKPQEILNTLVGEIGFDAEQFIRADAKEQLRILREVVGLDFTELDVEFDRVFKERTVVNVKAKQQAALVELKIVHADAPTELVSAAALMGELTKRGVMLDANQIVRSQAVALEAARKTAEEALRVADDAVAAAIRRRDEAKTWLETRDREAVAAQDLVESLVDPDVESVRQQISEADEQNRKYRENEQRQMAVDYHGELLQESAGKTQRLNEITDAKAKATVEATWPIPGLGFGEHGVTLNGVPFTQCSAMEKIKTAIAIRVALSPSLKFAFITDGAALDEKQLSEVATFAEEKGLQLFIERLGAGAECDIVISEGRIVGQAEPAIEQPLSKSKKKSSGTLPLEA